MKLSIITVSFNSEKTIEQTILSVISQDYTDIEYILIDGGSTDSTLEIANKYRDFIKIFISEPDFGIYHAMNKGLSFSTGDIIGFLNSDDFYLNAHVLSQIVNTFSLKDVDSVFGDVRYVDSVDTSMIKRYWTSTPYVLGAFKKGWHPPHPAFFILRSVYLKYGGFDLDFKISADFEWMLRLIEKNMITTAYLPSLIVNMRTGGESNKSLFNILIGNFFIFKAFHKNKIKVNIFTYPFYRFIPKIISLYKARL